MQNRIIGVLGRKGSGKSCALRELVAHAPRLLVWDPMAEHGGLCRNRLESIQRLVAFLHWTRGKSVWTAHYVPHHDLAEEFNLLAGWVYRYGRMVLAVEEVPMISQPNWVPPEFDRIIRLGRHRRIDLVWTGQRAAEIARRLTAATDVFVFYAQTEARDLEALADRCGAEVAAEVSRLGLHDRVVWDVLNRTMRRGKLDGLCFGTV
jgi:hypothetical protein